MKKLRNFKCLDGHIFEKLVTDNVTQLTCDCGKESKRMISAPRCFGNTTGKSPSTRY